MDVKVKLRQPSSKKCFVCGYENNVGLKSEFYVMENGCLVGLFHPLDEHQGYPGRLHGGIAAAILDEAIGRAINTGEESEVWGVTIDFSVRFKKPVPIESELKVVCFITKETRRTFEGNGFILLQDGTVAAQGHGKYMKMELDKIADMDVEGEEWVTVRERKLPSNIDIPEILLATE